MPKASTAFSPPQPIPPARRRFLLWVGVIASVMLVVAFVTAGLLVNIFEHKQEARNPFFRVVELTDDIDDPAL